jgi:hypothetical protein
MLQVQPVEKLPIQRHKLHCFGPGRQKQFVRRLRLISEAKALPASIERGRL